MLDGLLVSPSTIRNIWLKEGLSGPGVSP
jgi:hypothetical protein